MSNTEFHPCPICGAPAHHMMRYPHAVCRTCHDNACDDGGRKLIFYNISMSGGFEAVVAETQEKYPSHICYVKGVKCWADEARFGGTVVEPYDRSTNKYV